MTQDERLVQVVPSPRQLAFQQTEFYAFVHFTVNTFTGREWGDGTEPESIFNPEKLDADSWVQAIRSAGMKGLILTCKHHDGFCLWPSRYTEHSVKNSPFRGGKGDVVAEVAKACREGGLRFGVYLSPWDRHEATYGMGKEYDDYFVHQLEELLTGYSPVFSVWFDGACGEDPNGKKQVYDWDRYYRTIRRLQPDACINVCGPDIRWCGNEAGHTRVSEWSVVPKRTTETERIAENSQQQDDEQFRQRSIRASDQDFGSREQLREEPDLVWYPAEVNTSIRPGWFYHPEEDDKVRLPEELIRIYTQSVGGNATFLLNVPPTPEGLIHENDRDCLAKIGDFLRTAFAHNVLEGAFLQADSAEEGYGIENVREDGYDTYYRPAGHQNHCMITVTFPQETKVSYLVMKENIQKSQRIERFAVRDDTGMTVAAGTVVGYKKLWYSQNPFTPNTWKSIFRMQECIRPYRLSEPIKKTEFRKPFCGFSEFCFLQGYSSSCRTSIKWQGISWAFMYRRHRSRMQARDGVTSGM